MQLTVNVWLIKFQISKKASSYLHIEHLLIIKEILYIFILRWHIKHIWFI